MLIHSGLRVPGEPGETAKREREGSDSDVSTLNTSLDSSNHGTHTCLPSVSDINLSVV